MALSIEEAINRVPLWSGLPLKTSFLAGGITNQNYRVDVAGESFVLRIGGANTDLLGINRDYEYAATVAAAGLGLAPEVIHFIRPEGYLVTRFIPGQPLPPEVMGQPENISRVALALQQIHALPPIPATFSPFRTVEEYSRIAHQYGVIFPDNFDRLLAGKAEIEAAFLQRPFTPVLCHNDLLNENFLDDGQLRILDWEYAGMGDPFFDLANFAVHHGFTAEQETKLLQTYFGQASPAGQARLKLMKLMSDFREAMWGMVQQGISALEFDFRGYADKHFNRMASAMAEPDYRQWLGEAGSRWSVVGSRY
jgi:thiamine kinase-like enzyme